MLNYFISFTYHIQSAMLFSESSIIEARIWVIVSKV